MVFPKFIVEERGGSLVLIISKCTYHKQLVTDKVKVKGGGWWSLKETVFTLSGTSYEFGGVSIEDLKGCIVNRRVFSNTRLSRNLSEKHSFQFKGEDGEIIKL